MLCASERKAGADMHKAQDTQDVRLGKAAVSRPAMLLIVVFKTNIPLNVNPGLIVGLCLPERWKTAGPCCASFSLCDRQIACHK